MAQILWSQLEQEAKIQEERVKDLVLEAPPGAKSPEELFEELVEKGRKKSRENL